jgi:putative ATP-dependent endonuclease of OLD family
VRITRLRLSNFQSFGPEPTSIGLEEMTYVLGPNGAGKTAVLVALSKLFSPALAQRQLRPDDFHVSVREGAGEATKPNGTLWIEVDVEIAEAGKEELHPSVPPSFAHMRITTADGVPQVRVRLTGTLEADGFVDEKLEYIVEVDEHDEPTKRYAMSRHDRAHIEVHYLPAQRDPGHHISFSTASLVGRILRAVDWTAEREVLAKLSKDLTKALTANTTVSGIGVSLASEWTGLHTGEFFRDPTIAFGRGELEGILSQLTVTFAPSHGGEPLAFDRLSDGQKSLLYMSLVLAWQAMARRVLNGEDTSLDPDRLRPPVLTVMALEEPENSLSPQYLGRIVRQLRASCERGDCQALIATHAPTLLRRVPPEAICFLRLDDARQTTVRRIVLPDNDQEAAKYVSEAIKAFPELYFSRVVVLGEGDSELVVLPRVLAAAGIAEDDASVSVVPLGGRHVNHFWRLLNELDIPHVTLIDLDAGRYHGGWGRVRNALKQLNKVKPGTFAEKDINALPKWDANHSFPELGATAATDVKGSIAALEQHRTFFSNPVDLDLMMLQAYPAAYDVDTGEPDDSVITSVLGKSHKNEDRLPEEVRSLFAHYHARFGVQSKPATHLTALATLTDEALMAGLPEVLKRLVQSTQDVLATLPE